MNIVLVQTVSNDGLCALLYSQLSSLFFYSFHWILRWQQFSDGYQITKRKYSVLRWNDGNDDGVGNIDSHKLHKLLTFTEHIDLGNLEFQILFPFWDKKKKTLSQITISPFK